MTEIRSESTQIIPRVTGSQPEDERDGAAKARRARALLAGYMGEEDLTPDLEAEISVGVLQGLEVGTIVGDLVDGKSFLPTEQTPPKITARGQATVRTPTQIMLGIVRATGQELTSQDRRDLETGRRTPGQIINQKLGLAEARGVAPVPGSRVHHQLGRPVAAGRQVKR